MKILSINQTDITQIGGVNFSIKRVSEELVRRGHECYVLSINPGNLPREENIDGVNIIRVKSPMSKHLYGLSFSMGRFLRRSLGKSLNPDIVHIHDYRTLLTLEAASILRCKRLPFVLSPHYAREEYNTLAGKYLIRYYKPLGIWSFKWAKMVVTNSDYSKNMLVTEFDIYPEKIQVIAHGVDNLETPKEKITRAKEAPISLIYAGVLIEKKGVHYIIQAVAELKRRGIKASLVVIGEGDYKRELRELAENLQVEDCISWLSPLSRQELHRKFMEADMFLLPSRSESYGIVVAEALASRTPCIVSKRTALTEFLTEPGCFGIDYPPDPKELADLIVTIHDGEIKVGPFSHKIRTWDKVAADYEKLYDGVTGHSVG